MRPYRVWRWFWQYVGPPLGAVGLGKTFDFTVHDVLTAGGHAWSLLLSLKALWVLLAVVSFFLSFVEWRHRNTPLTIVSTKVELYLESADGHARVKKTQTIRANREDVTGYQSKFWADPSVARAAIPPESIEMHIDHCRIDQQDHMVLGGTEKGWEVIHRFQPIPWKFGLKKVRRTEKYRLLYSFGKDVEWYDVAPSQIYRHRSVVLAVYFHPDRPCDKKQCKGYWIARHGAVELNLQEATSDTGQSGWSLTVNKPVSGGIYRILWTYEKKQPGTASAPQSN